MAYPVRDGTVRQGAGVDKEAQEYKDMKCAKCDNEATRRLTPDLDIHGIPVCDSKECEKQIRHELIIRIYEEEQEQEAGKGQGR